MSADIPKYVQRQPSGIYRYYRRVLVEVAQHDKRTFIKVRLKTKNHKEALEKAQGVHDATERLWSVMASGNDNKPEWERYEAAIRTAQSLGFAYRPVAEIAVGNFEDLYVRSKQAAELSATQPAAAKAIVGLVDSPNPRISDIWQMYEQFNQAGFMGMSPKQ
ncbi:hypothetical protein LAV78_16110 [Brucella intermedia]|uniref:DUF6538 domain-containing protein n=1 Tax=Brucella intermedia TaxID=94625 RepID=UPI001E417B3C|nr:DUF6538 domain-containing protein [Brucella intermedia]MCB4920047.1 hypothetical protein [Brucella intermedia]